MKKLTVEEIDTIEKAIYAYRAVRPQLYWHWFSYMLQSNNKFEKDSKLDLDILTNMRLWREISDWYYKRIMAFVKQNKKNTKKVQNLLQSEK